MNSTINILDVIALTDDIAEKGLYRGQVGTVVELLSPDVFEIEFIDNNGKTYSTAAIHRGKLIVLHYHPIGDSEGALA